MSGLFILKIEWLDFWDATANAFLGSGTALKTVEYCKELFLFLENNAILDFSSIFHQFLPLLKLRDEKSWLHFFFLIFFELKSFEVKSFEEIFISDLAPIFDGMDIFDVFELIKLGFNPILEDFACLYIWSFEEPLNFFFLIPMTIFVYHLQYS